MCDDGITINGLTQSSKKKNKKNSYNNWSVPRVDWVYTFWIWKLPKPMPKFLLLVNDGILVESRRVYDSIFLGRLLHASIWN